ncbi:MAG TPA: phosphodiester glycosidase family protein [Nitrospiraceae bacterium]|nr:phosphodiester glycosidase family protein [Nitrospiraceae bacterium]
MVRNRSFHRSLRFITVARFFLGLIFVISGGRSLATAQTLTGDQLGNGLSISVWSPHAQCPGVAPLVAVEIDPDRYRFAVHYYQQDGFSEPPDIRQWQERTGHDLVFNAGLFRENYAYLGLLYGNGRSLGSRRHATWQGLFAAEPAADRSRRARVFDLTFDTFDEQQVPYREVAQSLMLLDRTGKIRVRQTGKRAHQTLVAEQSDGHLLVLKTTEVVSLHALGECLRDAFPSLRQVMAMDGGSSSDLAVSPSLQQAMSKAAGIHDWIPLLEDSITTHIGLPAVIGVSPRREQTGVKAVGK